MIAPVVAAFLNTLVIEGIVIALLSRSWRIVLFSLVINGITHPLFIGWGVYLLGWAVLLVEPIIFIFEAVLYRFLGFAWRQAMLFSVAANVASLFGGVLLRWMFR